MENLRVGVIGLGMGRWHVERFNSHPQAEVTAITDLDETRLNEIGDQNNIHNRYTSAQEMLENENLDVVGIATPNHTHYPLTIAALEKGCHVLCEKPMAMNAVEATKMITASQAAGKRLMINFNYRFSEQSMALKEQVDSGILGDIYYARTIWHRRRGLPRFGGWFGKKAMSGGGPLIDLGVHRLDLALWLMGYPKPSWVMGSTYNTISQRLASDAGIDFDVEDLAVALIKFDNGATLEVEASWAAYIKEKEMMETRLLGTQGGLVQRNLEEGYKFKAELFVERNGSHFDMSLHQPYKPVTTSMAHFIDSIINDTPHIATAQEGLLVMEILDAIYQSADQGKPIEIT